MRGVEYLQVAVHRFEERVCRWRHLQLKEDSELGRGLQWPSLRLIPAWLPKVVSVMKLKL